jgi:enoyl-CoA hydratase/carnithine racemase
MGDREMGSELVLERRDANVLWLTLNQPDKRNPLSSEMIDTLSGLLEKGYTDEAIRVIVLASTGPVFSAGHDLSEMNQRADEDAAAFSERIGSILEKCASMMKGMVNAPKPVIACVQGTATAAGCQLVSACDLAIAASDAGFCTPGVNVGVFCTTPLVGIGRNLSRKHAMEMALTGDIFGADDAVQFGLINRHVSGNELHKETEALASKIASRSAQSIRDGKHIFYQQIEMSLSDAFSLANEAMRTAVTKTEDAAEGRRAFLDKNTPKWDGL